MSVRKSLIGGILLLASTTTAVMAAGSWTNGFPQYNYPTGIEQFPMDTELPSGAYPQSAFMTLNQLKQFSPVPTTLSGSTITANYNLGSVFFYTTSGNFTLANPTNLQSGGRLLFVITQGSTTGAATYGSLFTFTGGTNTLSTTSGYVDAIRCDYDGIKLRCNLSTHYE